MKRYKPLFEESNKIENALNNLHKIRIVDAEENQISTKSIFKNMKDKLYLRGTDINKLKDSIKEHKLIDVKIDELIATQSRLRVDVIEEYIQNSDSKQFDKYSNSPKEKYPIVVFFKDTLYIDDGHHRIASLKLLGYDSCKVIYVDRVYKR